MGKKARPLTLKQRRFVQALPTANSQKEAAIIAGYSPIVAAEVGSQSLRLSNVTAAIQAQSQAMARSTIATVVERKEKLSEILRKPAPEKVGVEAIISASDQLNRMENLYIRRNESVNLNLDAELAQFSLEELGMMLEEARARKAKA